MNIVIAAEKSSIASLLSEYIRRHVEARDIKVTENPDETGSFYVGLHCERFIMSPDGHIAIDRLTLRD